MGEVVQAFTTDEAAIAERELAGLGNLLRQAKGPFEEYHWRPIYCKAKGIEGGGTWSNLAFNDLLHQGLGIEWKVLKRPSPKADQGRMLMHPAATRKLDYDPTGSAEAAKNAVLNQWGAEIRGFQQRVQATSDTGIADIRWGILLWSSRLTEFLYFEEKIEVPRPREFRGQWVDGRHRGQRTRNLHIFERATGTKRYSVTLPKNGAKLQPYFDIPTVEQGAHLFEIGDEPLFPLWVSKQTYEDLGAADEEDHDAMIRQLME